MPMECVIRAWRVKDKNNLAESNCGADLTIEKTVQNTEVHKWLTYV